MSKSTTIIDKIEDLFKRLPEIESQKECLTNLKVIMEARIEEENKAMQDKINQNLKLKEGK